MRQLRFDSAKVPGIGRAHRLAAAAASILAACATAGGGASGGSDEQPRAAEKNAMALVGGEAWSDIFIP